VNKYLEKALDVAKTSKCRYKHGCVVVYDGKIVSQAANRKIGDARFGWRKAHVHAEIAAVTAAGSRASGSYVYVARVAANGLPAESEPCKKCHGYLVRAGVSKVVWT
jgi:pyrimidine deaminase RibD-like protein